MPRSPFLWLFFLLALATPSIQAQDLTRIKHRDPDLAVDLGVGLWAWPLPMDYDGDGDLDLVVSCPDYPYGGVYLFENPGGDASFPTFKPAKRIGNRLRNVAISYVDGKPRVLMPGAELPKVLSGDLKTTQKIHPNSTIPGVGKIRANQWSYVDFNGDDALDLVVGLGEWGDYGWDNAFNEKGEWTNGPLHGHVYLLANQGTTAEPDYAKAVKVTAAGKAIDVYGMPSPNFGDFDSDGDLDLICGEFVDGFTWFENTGTRTEPKYAAGRPLATAGKSLKMPLCMIVVSSIDWDRDGDIDLIVGQEDGRVAYLEHTGKIENHMPIFAEPKFFQQQADDVKFGALATPVAFDWDGDGKQDIISGNTAGEIGFIKNLSGGETPKWAAPVLLKAGGEIIRIEAGVNGSIQGPAETKWGYTTLDIADWNHDGLPDILANSIWGKVIWYENVGTLTAPKLAAAKPVRIEWPGEPKYPAWNWWSPAKGEFATQWRTTPLATDWNEDGLVDLVMLDHEGYLAFFERNKNGTIQPGKRIFANAKGAPLRLNSGIAGRSGRKKLCLVDWDGDGRRDLLVNSKNADWMRNITPEGSKKIIFAAPKQLAKRQLAGHTTSPTVVDFNSDGTPELLVGAEDGFFYHAPRATIAKPQAKAPKTKPTSATSKSAKPNVLFIGVDDMRVELGCYGNKEILSPHIDGLASGGTLFQRAYCQQAVCNPSRASLMSGLRPDQLRVWDLPTHFRETQPDVVTLPQLFKQNGYQTVNVGKMFHNWRQDKFKGDPKSWSKPAVMHYNSHSNDQAMVEGKTPPDLSGVPRTECRDVPDDAYFDGRIATQAINELRELQDKPFFLAVGFWKPHAPFNAPKKYWDLYERDSISPAAHDQPPKNVPPIALHDSREILRGFKNRPTGRPNKEEVRTLRHGYFAAISYVDAQIGRVLQELDRLKLRDNTIVVFWSDHGFHLGEHGLWAKTSNFELDARVPMIISAPGFAANAQSDALVELIDLYPTLADLCRLQAPKSLAGVSLTPILRDASKSVKTFALTQHTRPAYPPPGEDPPFMGYSIRTPNWRYTQWRDFKTGEIKASELYDHRKSSDELVNVVGESENRQRVAELAKELTTRFER